MPLHQIFHPPGLYSAEEKANIAARITAVYHALPAFFVVVVFTPVPAENVYVAARSHRSFVRITIDHIARSMNGDVPRMEAFMERYEAAIAPATRDKEGVDDWEVSVQETPNELWRINGIRPPMRPGEEAIFETWKREVKPSKH